MAHWRENDPDQGKRVRVSQDDPQVLTRRPAKSMGKLARDLHVGLWALEQVCELGAPRQVEFGGSASACSGRDATLMSIDMLARLLSGTHTSREGVLRGKSGR